MAIFRKGANEGYTGRTGNVITYLLNGKLVKRRIGKNLKPPTIPQLASRQVTSITSKFLSPLNSFIRVGFKLEAKRTLLEPYNIASSYNRQHAIAGSYPDQYINFENALLTKGNMPATPGITVKKDADGLVFTWNTTSYLKGTEDSDRVMLMAYMPDKGTAIYLLYAARRCDGTARLHIPKMKVQLKVETYLSFASHNLKSIANSTYTGQLII